MTSVLQWRINSGDGKSTINQHSTENEAPEDFFTY